jgi:hypothetical protein
MSAKRPAQPKNKVGTPTKVGATIAKAKKGKRVDIHLTAKELEQQFQSVLLNLQQNSKLSVSLFNDVQNLLDNKLKVVYEAVDKLTKKGKQQLQADIVAGATIKSKPVMKRIAGSLDGLLSLVISVNKDQKQLYDDMLAAKLFTTLAVGTNLKVDKELAPRFIEKVELLIKNEANLRNTLRRNLILKHGKGLTLEPGKDLSAHYKTELQSECKKLLEVVESQIAMNEQLKRTLKIAASTPEAEAPQAPAQKRQPR